MRVSASYSAGLMSPAGLAFVCGTLRHGPPLSGSPFAPPSAFTCAMLSGRHFQLGDVLWGATAASGSRRLAVVLLPPHHFPLAGEFRLALPYLPSPIDGIWSSDVFEPAWGQPAAFFRAEWPFLRFRTKRALSPRFCALAGPHLLGYDRLKSPNAFAVRLSESDGPRVLETRVCTPTVVLS